jgi:hypothetical protein
VQKRYPSLPPLVRLRDNPLTTTEEREMIQHMIEQIDMTEAELSSPLYMAINKNLKFLSHLTKTQLTSKNLASPKVYEMANGVAFIIFGRIQTGSSKAEPPNPIHFDYMPLSIFDLVHFNIYDSENYRTSNSRQELRERAQAFNSSKWTKQAIQLSTSWERNANRAFSDPNVNMSASYSQSVPKKFSVSPVGRKSALFASTPSSNTSTPDRLPQIQRESSVRDKDTPL